MRARHISYHLIATFLVFGVAQVSYSQEYDDLYFTTKDRNMLKLADERPTGQSSISEATIEQFTEETYTDDYSAKNVNPEYIARYQSQAVQGDNNPAYGTYVEPDEEVEYFSEEEIDSSEPPTIINNYYGSTPYRYQPNRWAFRPSMAFGYNSYRGWSSGFGLSMSYGDPFWNPYYDPFFSPYYANYYRGVGYYDPWYDPYYCPPSYGYSYFPRRNAYLVGYYNGYYAGGGGRVVVVGDTRPRQYVSGSRYGRGGMVTGVSRSIATSTATRSQGITPNVTTSSPQRGTVSRGRVSRGEYNRTQNEYYNRSRSRVASSSSSSGGRVESTNVRAGTSRSYRSGTTPSSYEGRTSPRSSAIQRVGRSATPSGSRPSTIDRSSSNSSRRYSTSGNNPGASRSRTYNPSNSGRRTNRIFSSPARSNSSRSYNRSASPSRSSSFSTPSRSSGSSINRSSGSSRSISTPSRSSSGSRSSGNRSSSSRSRRGNQ